eukprot:8807402-Pyramimonas_sp.AAC.1
MRPTGCTRRLLTPPGRSGRIRSIARHGYMERALIAKTPYRDPPPTANLRPNDHVNLTRVPCAQSPHYLRTSLTASGPYCESPVGKSSHQFKMRRAQSYTVTDLGYVPNSR